MINVGVLIIVSVFAVVVIVLLSYIIYSINVKISKNFFANLKIVVKSHGDNYDKTNASIPEDKWQEIYGIGWNNCRGFFKQHLCKMYQEASRNGDGELISKYLYRHLDDYFDDEIID